MKTAIISPSGNLYGSELVLLDFLHHTVNKYYVYVPKPSTLELKINNLSTQHKIKNFNGSILPFFYFKLFLKMMFGLINKVYWNEGGHIRYAKLLANIFKNKTIYVHIRIIEDTKIERLGKIPDNLKLLTVSDFMYDLISPNYDVTMIYDPYIFKEFDSKIKLTKEHNRIGIVGRITKTKGLDYFNNLLLKLEEENNNRYEFHFFGDSLDDDEEVINLKMITSRNIIKINFHGFVNDINLIYDNIDILLHLSTQESLGRIIFEAISYNKPFIVFDMGGSAEIARKLELNELIIKFDSSNKWVDEMIALIMKIKNDYSYYSEKVSKSKLKAVQIYSIENYTSFIDKLIN